MKSFITKKNREVFKTAYLCNHTTDFHATKTNASTNFMTSEKICRHHVLNNHRLRICLFRVLRHNSREAKYSESGALVKKWGFACAVNGSVIFFSGFMKSHSDESNARTLLLKKILPWKFGIWEEIYLGLTYSNGIWIEKRLVFLIFFFWMFFLGKWVVHRVES
jgi:hypothetical protein